jgi:hypothetical protein
VADLDTCVACGGFTPVAASRCPHCDATIARPFVRRALAVVTGGAVAMTLMACYGGAPVGSTVDGGVGTTSLPTPSAATSAKPSATPAASSAAPSASASAAPSSSAPR